MAQIISGTAVSKEIKEELKIEVAELRGKGISVSLAVIQVGADPASCVYVGNKKKACAYIGIESLSYELPEETTQDELLALIQKLNQDDHVDGILVQLPLPKHIEEEKVIQAIIPTKDVDGFHPMNVGAMCVGDQGFLPCTPAGVIELCKRSGVTLAGKNCIVLGRSNIVGKPMALLLLREDATVTIAHSKTENLRELTKQADVIVAAVGRPKMITKEYVKDGATIIDVGIHRDSNNKLCGDVDFEDVLDTCNAITPVPGGVGPMTIAMLMRNCVEAAKLK